MENRYLQSRDATLAEAARRIRAEEMEELVRISLSDSDMDTILVLYRFPGQESIRYTLDVDIDNADAELDLYFDGIIGEEVLARTYLMADDLINDDMDRDYIISSWGQLQIAMMNRNRKTMELLIFFNADNADEGSGIYLRMELDENMTQAVRDSLFLACKKYNKSMV